MEKEVREGKESEARVTQTSPEEASEHGLERLHRFDRRKD